MTRSFMKASQYTAFLNIRTMTRNSQTASERSTIVFWGKARRDTQFAAVKCSSRDVYLIENSLAKDRQVKMAVNRLFHGLITGSVLASESGKNSFILSGEECSHEVMSYVSVPHTIKLSLQLFILKLQAMAIYE